MERSRLAWVKKRLEEEMYWPVTRQPDDRYKRWKAGAGIDTPKMLVIETTIRNLLCDEREHVWNHHKLVNERGSPEPGFWSFDHCLNCGAIRHREFIDPSHVEVTPPVAPS